MTVLGTNRISMLYWMGRGWRPTKPLRSEVLLRKVEERWQEPEHADWSSVMEDTRCDSEEAFRRSIVPLARDLGSAFVGEVFDVDPAKLAAWLAVDTRRSRTGDP